ncbi:BRO family protein [Pseudodesulfovibrio tunisiensis]|uniref:BRO family protein n=1 Tax=Pseudodesulfovibrio tunisiensis TaxID=463192 RepID=UPI001FB2508C|nr:phage antirepressor [Pseudodesulfovibrio tunisiensis]
MPSNIIPFQFDQANVRVVQDDQGEPWFVAKDVAEVLGYADTDQAIRSHCKAALTSPVKMTGQARHMKIIPERDVYRLIMRSKLPAAERFEEWVVGEVLPTIRKHGAYMTPEKIEEALLNPDTIIRLATDLKTERQKRLAESKKREVAEAERDRLKPKAETLDSLMASDTALPIGSVAKALHKDFGIGRNKLFKFLRDRGVLMANNEPKQIYMDRGYFRVVERRYEVHGEMRVGTQTLVYQRGVTFIVKLLRKSEDKEAA